ncbi:hypothetical protein BGZ61DRAFT_369924 [Ilyonectria robusta]|uniref:uncharacterized protein n=1 Tax=Ilyonectria robusta TaxID=1079257 RepID=UPI001E8D2854|nr:uncharacterized protein BGZ61DRAFT_369924 [Ilyonectria robusta]KAH8659715.1 hypothetical protein BGZ61DRAFT_369924 [Ilyonectria robusta]
MSSPASPDQKITQNAIIISAFPCAGKSWLEQHHSHAGYPVLDLDFSRFSFLVDGKTGNPQFKENDLDEIQKFVGQRTVILVSTPEELQNGLKDRGLKYFLVFPERGLKNQWLTRLKKRGDYGLADLLQKDWEKFITGCMKQKGCEMHTLGSGQYL